ncbi:hypothetical protein Pint_31733 [Pistacia integerrima]|uniref:Uncharacterized protein n=1 Tax=Pistacia integerrima TaxID=434235 RepID=A0ACC0XRN9_9ROSI|nr:hypothetical protein Pint_31733 [Pistacia integerrima]
MVTNCDLDWQGVVSGEALDTFNTTVVSPIYYTMFTSFTIFANAIMFKDYSGQSASSIASELSGFITVLLGTIALHRTREPDPHFIADQEAVSLAKRMGCSVGEWLLHKEVHLENRSGCSVGECI